MPDPLTFPSAARTGPFLSLWERKDYPPGCRPGASWPVRATYSV